jgi:hypothetical protein
VRAAPTRVVVVVVVVPGPDLGGEFGISAAAVGTPRMRMTRGPFRVPFAIVRGP